MGGQMTPDDTTVQSLVLWVAAISTLFSFGTLIWNVFSGPSRKNAARLEKLTQRFENQEQRIAKLEQAHSELPGKEAFHKLELAMVQSTGELGKVAEILLRLETTVLRHDDFLRKER